MGSWARLYVGVRAEVGSSGRLVSLEAPSEWPPPQEFHAKYFLPALWAVGAGTMHAVEVETLDAEEAGWAAFTFDRVSDWLKRLDSVSRSIEHNLPYAQAWWALDLLRDAIAAHPADSQVVLELSEILASIGDTWDEALADLRSQLDLGTRAASGNLPQLNGWPWLDTDLGAAASEIQRASGTESPSEALLYAACGWPSRNPRLVAEWEAHSQEAEMGSSTVSRQ